MCFRFVFSAHFSMATDFIFFKGNKKMLTSEEGLKLLCFI